MIQQHLEDDIVIPSLYVIRNAEDGTISTTDLIKELRRHLRLSERDKEILQGRKDDRFSQTVRNLVSHKKLVNQGYAEFVNGFFTITDEGLEYLDTEEVREYIENELEIIEEKNIEIEEKIESQKLNIDKLYSSVFELKRKWEANPSKLKLDPDYQRGEVWTKKQKSELIESILMNIPLPFIYLSQHKDGTFSVIDGRQRLSALFTFINDDFKLDKKLNILKDIANKKFSELSGLQRGILEDYQIVAQLIKPPTSDRMMIDIFERVNRSGTQLNHQEIRNALYQGKATKLLDDLAETYEFKTATDNSVKPKRMKDRYIILRFLSFYIWQKEFLDKNEEYEYKGNIDDFLGKYMRYMNDLEDNKIDILKSTFISAMKNAITFYNSDAFRLQNRRNNIKRPINMSLFESLGYLLSHEICTKDINLTKQKIALLIAKEEFQKSFLSIDGSVKYRYTEMNNILKELNA